MRGFPRFIELIQADPHKGTQTCNNAFKIDLALPVPLNLRRSDLLDLFLSLTETQGHRVFKGKRWAFRYAGLLIHVF